MPDAALEELDLARHGRWIHRMAGAGVRIGVAGADGMLMWEEPQAEGRVGEVLGAHIRNGFDWRCEGQGMQRHAAESGAALLYQPLHSRAGTLIGYLLLVADDLAISIDQLAEAVDDVAAAIADEYMLYAELNTMASELSERYEELHLVYAIDQQLRDLQANSDIFASLLQSCADHMNVDVAAFVRPNDNLCVSAVNLSKPIHNLDLVLVEMRGDLFRFVNAARQSLVLNHMHDPRRSYIFTDMPLKVLCCPVFQHNAVVGVLVMLNDIDKPDFSNSDRKLGEVLANQFSSLARLYGMLTEAGQFNAQMAAALIESVEAKDPYTRGHSERVHHISMEIGRAMKLPDDELDNLHWGSLLHDVGKIGIPDAILCKPARLTQDEFTFIMVHPERSYEILRHIDRLKNAVPGARHHQEKYDGTGYPHRLRGEQIPLNARIIAVADTYDSITSSRAYRAGRSHEVAMTEMRRVAGSQLDPAIIGVFEEICALEPAWLRRFGIRREQRAESIA